MSRALLLLGVLPACFGAGPMPTQPTDATVVFRVPTTASVDCAPVDFIGDVAIGGAYGYAVLLPYVPPNNCNGGGLSPVGVPVYRFSTAATDSGQVGMAGLTQGQGYVRVGANAARGAWAHLNTEPPMQAISVQVADTQATPTLVTASLPFSSGSLPPAGLVVDDTRVFIAGFPGFSGPEPNNPQYPCCGPTTQNQTTVGAWSVQLTDLVVTPLPLTTQPLHCDTLKDCLVANTSTLFYTARGSDSLAPISINRFPKTGVAGDVTVIDQIDRANGVPVGLAASATTLVWTTSIAYAMVSGTALPSPKCTITKHDLATGQTEMLYTTDAFSCIDAALDDTHVYFAIIGGFDDNGNSQLSGMTGAGIGRVSLSGGALESVAHGIEGKSAGPRRIYLQGNELFAVDPFAIARINKSALDGHEDF